MMVIVPRIAAVSYLNTIPFIYGIEHEGNLRAELLLSPPAVCKTDTRCNGKEFVSTYLVYFSCFKRRTYNAV